jgi:hypothetical protein
MSGAILWPMKLTPAPIWLTLESHLGTLNASLSFIQRIAIKGAESLLKKLQASHHCGDSLTCRAA